MYIYIHIYIYLHDGHVGAFLGASVSIETYYSVKRDLLQCQKRPTTL